MPSFSYNVVEGRRWQRIVVVVSGGAAFLLLLIVHLHQGSDVLTEKCGVTVGISIGLFQAQEVRREV